MIELREDIFNDWIIKDINNYSTRFEVYYGGASSSKSYEVTRKMILKAMKYPKRKVLIVRKVQSTLKDSCFALVKHQLEKLGLLSYCRVNKSDYEIELPNGSIFLFKGMDDQEKIKSIVGINDILIEEATELTLIDFKQLNLRLRDKAENKQMYLIFNPISKANWVYQRWFLNGTPKNTKIIHTTYLDNKFLDQDTIEELEELKNGDYAFYKVYALGEFATLDKLVFPIFEQRLIGIEEVAELPRFQGLDFGYTNDPSAFVGGRIDIDNKIIYITDEYVKKGMLNDEIAQVIINLGYQKNKTYADSAEPKSIEEIKRKDVNIEETIKGQDSVIHGIQYIQQFKLVVDERCFKTIEELQNYTWKKDKSTQEYINKPNDSYNHCIDAIRYGLNKYIKGARDVKITSKVSIGLYADNKKKSYWG